MYDGATPELYHPMIEFQPNLFRRAVSMPFSMLVDTATCVKKPAALEALFEMNILSKNQTLEPPGAAHRETLRS